MAIYIKEGVQQKEVGTFKRGETFLHDDEYYIVTIEGIFSLITGYDLEIDLSAKVTPVHLLLSRVV